jgi:hypothetical protein
MQIDEIDRVLNKVPKQTRVAVACVAVERVLDLYRFGNLHPTVKDLPEIKTKLAKDRELLDLGLEIAWAFVEGEKVDKPMAAAIVAWVGDHLWQKKVPKKIAAGSECALKAIRFTLLAIDDEETQSCEQALSMAEIAASISMRQLGLSDDSDDDDDDDIPSAVGDAEEAWQIKVVKHVAKNKTAAASKAMFAELRAQEPSWRQYLPQYKKKFSS